MIPVTLPRSRTKVAARPAAAASTINVTTTADENANPGSGCSLREAILTANTNTNTGGCRGAAGGPFTINLGVGTFSLTAGELPVGITSGANISIVGAGTASTTVRQAVCATARVFDLDPSVVGNVAVSISGITISNGAAQAFGGGAILGGARTTRSSSPTRCSRTTARAGPSARPESPGAQPAT